MVDFPASHVIFRGGKFVFQVVFSRPHFMLQPGHTMRWQLQQAIMEAPSRHDFHPACIKGLPQSNG